ncbi:LPP20 family lipoprotein, partial [Candidatus Sumerlaeota bacterium]|nr:LPP20 family lipoprotein [Candidatus Sumerlaeota bacterium]
MIKTRFMFILALCVISVLSFGCKKRIPVSIKVTGNGAADRPISPPAPDESQPLMEEIPWAGDVIEATGTGVRPDTASSDAQARLMAKKAARTDAQRNLLEQIQGLEIKSQTTVRNFMTEHDEIRTKVDGFIAGAEVVSETEQPDGAWEVKMQMDLNPLSQVILTTPPPSPVPPAVPPVPVGTSGQARLMAERAAVLDGHRQILEQLKGVHIDSSTTVEDFMTRNDRIRSRVEGLVRGARI